MKFSVLLAAALGISAADANLLQSYSQHRPAKHRVARTLPAFTKPPVRGKFVTAATVKAAADQDSVLGGAVVSAPNIVSAAGTFRVPEARQPTRGPTADNPITYGASFWVGIDGAGACASGSSLRAGVDIFWDPEGTSYNAWYQLAPANSVDFAAPLSVAPGDSVRVTASAPKAAAPANGTAAAPVSVTFENLSTGEQATQTFPAEAAAGLCRAGAAWAVEDFVLEQSIGLPVALVDFDNATFSDMAVTAACSTTGTPSRVSLDSATVANIVQPEQGGRLTECTRTGAELVCERIYESS